MATSPTIARGPRAATDGVLSPREWSATRTLVWRVLEEVPAELVEAALFGSKARADAGPDSDVDLLLVFRDLPPDREPHAGMAERIADEVAEETGIPVTVWSVSLPDLRQGERTPMLVDALVDALPIWCWPEPLEPVSFTPADALHCCGALLARVREGSIEFAERLRLGDRESAARRARDDLIRLGTALLLLRGITRPRRGEVVEDLLATEFAGTSPPAHVRLALDWVRLSFGPSGKREGHPLEPPPGGLLSVSRAIDYLRGRVFRAANGLALREGHGTRPEATFTE